MSDELLAPEGAQICEVCGRWTEETCTREEAVDEFGMFLVEDDEGDEMLVCELCA
jgi:hypothetical protein